MMKFKDPGVELYSAEDRARLAKGLKPLPPGLPEESPSETEESAASESSSELMDGAEQCENLMFDLAGLPTDLGQTAASLLTQNLHNLRRIGSKKYDLWNGKKNVD